jgi:type IV pilus assembly protein PilQ
VLINTRMKIFDGDNGETPRIRLNLKITVSELSGFIQTGTTSTPQTNSREYTQTVEIPNGYTLALGGLNSEEVNDKDKKIPVLGDIPVLGYLFKSKDKAKQLRSLIGYITPTIVDESLLLKSTAKIEVTSNGNVEAVLP